MCLMFKEISFGMTEWKGVLRHFSALLAYIGTAISEGMKGRKIVHTDIR